jgi:hypothetical protein
MINAILFPSKGHFTPGMYENCDSIIVRALVTHSKVVPCIFEIEVCVVTGLQE